MSRKFLYSLRVHIYFVFSAYLVKEEIPVLKAAALPVAAAIPAEAQSQAEAQPEAQPAAIEQGTPAAAATAA